DVHLRRDDFADRCGIHSARTSFWERAMISFFQQYPEYCSDWIARLLLGARISAELSLMGFALAAILGALLAWAMRSPSVILKRSAAFFIQSMRAVPLLALLLEIGRASCRERVESWEVYVAV